jgi:hypothetical protein
MSQLSGAAAEVKNTGVFRELTQHQIFENWKYYREKGIPPVLVVHPGEGVIRRVDGHIYKIIT